MWLTWYSLNANQKLQARELSRYVRQSPSEYEYLVDDDENVTDYRHIYD